MTMLRTSLTALVLLSAPALAQIPSHAACIAHLNDAHKILATLGMVSRQAKLDAAPNLPGDTLANIERSRSLLSAADGTAAAASSDIVAYINALSEVCEAIRRQ